MSRLCKFAHFLISVKFLHIYKKNERIKSIILVVEYITLFYFIIDYLIESHIKLIWVTHVFNNKKIVLTIFVFNTITKKLIVLPTI